MADRRRFNRGERVAMYLADQGLCAGCGTALLPGWHADHIEAWAAGGETDVTNGQPMCPTCNLKKGVKSVARADVNPWPDSDGGPGHLRKWHSEALQRFREKNGDFSIVATPGAGKTRVALRIAHDLFQRGIIQRLVVVVPTTHLRRQWHDAAASVGLQLHRSWENDGGLENHDFHGITVTYQTIASQPDLHRMLCARVPTLVVLDEIHHAGDKHSWGDGLRRAFDPAMCRLLLSGTPFRSDNATIPFIEYENGRSKADFSYGYDQAIQDNVCRPVLFPRYDGTMEWLSGGQTWNRTFRDELPPDEAARRLRTALLPEADWLREVLRDADREITQARENGHAGAAGLVVCIDQQHAQAIGALLERVTGSVPVIAVSDDPDASDKIHAFAEGMERWIVAVRMVSEGVDIPRLRACVYATNVISELFFRQVVGRLVRVMPDLDEQCAYLFMPDEENLRAYAEQIARERDHAVEMIDKEERERLADDGDDRIAPRQMGLYAPISAEPEAAGVTFEQQHVEMLEWKAAKDQAEQAGRSSMSDIAFVVKILRQLGVEPNASVQPAAPSPSAHDESGKLRTTRTLLVRQFGGLVRETWKAETRQEFDTSDVMRYVQQKLIKATGARVKTSTREQLADGNRMVQEWIQELRAASERRWGASWIRDWQETNDRVNSAG